ncbi:hypothetical protein IWX90DRAFT_479180 [Phyllosticta citrichinensis]|uniref:Uncharacterized protein n=1 Tax=Phyllosticta citrichinensis TaxID=1130410 RepID=A0ABR1XML5_9PEZI
MAYFEAAIIVFRALHNLFVHLCARNRRSDHGTAQYSTHLSTALATNHTRSNSPRRTILEGYRIQGLHKGAKVSAVAGTVAGRLADPAALTVPPRASPSSKTLREGQVRLKLARKLLVALLSPVFCRFSKFQIPQATSPYDRAPLEASTSRTGSAEVRKRTVWTNILRRVDCVDWCFVWTKKRSTALERKIKALRQHNAREMLPICLSRNHVLF